MSTTPSSQTRKLAYESYILPSDDLEERRLQMQQTILREVFGGRVVIPLIEFSQGSEVLDIGTGSGAWMLEFAARYPNAEATNMTGVDIGALLFPKAHPQNMAFKIISALEMPAEWTNKFMLVHQRCMLGSVTYNEWEVLVRDIYRVTAPGGWAQLCEVNMVPDIPGVTKGPATLRLTEAVTQLALHTGFDLVRCATRIPELMKAAGFVDIQVQERVIPLGAWNGDLSRKSAVNAIAIYRGLKTAMLKFGALQDAADYDALMEEAEREWAAGPSSNVGWYVTFGRKAN